MTARVAVGQVVDRLILLRDGGECAFEVGDQLAVVGRRPGHDAAQSVSFSDEHGGREHEQVRGDQVLAGELLSPAGGEDMRGLP